MKAKLTAACLILGASLAGASMISYATDDTDSDRSHPKAFVKDSAITTKVKSKLAAEHLPSLMRIHVDTDADGVVWLSGTARNQDEIEKAVSIARGTEECVACGVRRPAIGLVDGLGVDGQRETRVAVTKPGLGGLHVDTTDDEGGGRGPAQIVEADSFAAGGVYGRDPDPRPPV